MSEGSSLLSSRMLTPSIPGSKSVRKQNQRLAEELGRSPSSDPLYRWIHSEDDLLTQPMLVFGPDRTPVYDYHCRCGVNIAVHRPGCALVVPRRKWQRRRLMWRHKDQWILCGWLPPPPRMHWESVFPGAPYPANGYYAPVGDSRKTICILPGQEPLPPTTELIITSIREARSKSAAQQLREIDEEIERKEEDFRRRLKDEVKDAMTFHLGIPGKKGGQDYSFGGDPGVPSPNMRKFEEVKNDSSGSN